MGILRKYLWLVLPIIFFANYANADTCENDPYACTPAKLCSKTTEKVNNVLYWISSEEDKHLKVAQKINLNRGAKDAMSSCQKDASGCSILELCEVATTKEVSATNWNEVNPRHVKLAKSFGLDCGVKEAQAINQVNKTNTNKSISPCDLNPAACVSEELCEKATYGVVGNKNWTTLQVFVEFVKEAKQRGLTCGVKSTSIDKTCSQDVLKCTPFELCKLATKKNANGKNIWSMAEYRKKYIEEAQRRNISCGVNYTKNAKTCSQDVLKCTPSELCDAATYTINKTTDWKVGAYKKYVKEAKRRNISCGVKSISNDKICSQDVLKCTPTELCDAATYTINETTDWKVGAYKKYVKEAKRRNISCGVKSASNNQVKADEKARLALKAEKKRKADEKARLALAAEKKRKADEKARLALAAEKKRKADEKARLALAAEKKRKATKEARLVAEALRLSSLIEKGKARSKALLHSKKEYNNYFVQNEKLLNDLEELYVNLLIIRKQYEYLSYDSDTLVKSNWNRFNSSFPGIEEKIKTLLGEELVNKINKKYEPKITEIQNQFKKNGDDWHWDVASILNNWLFSRTYCLRVHDDCGDRQVTGLSEKFEKLMLSVAFLNNYHRQFEKDYYQTHYYSKPILNNDIRVGLSLPKGWSASSSNKDTFYSFAGNGADSISIRVNSILEGFGNLPLYLQSIGKGKKTIDAILQAHQTSDPYLIKILNETAIKEGCIPLFFPIIYFKVDDLTKQNPIRVHKQFCTKIINNHKVETIKHAYSHLKINHWINIECEVLLQITKNNNERFKEKRTGGLDMSSLCGTISNSLVVTAK